jgi:nitrogen regulatory protein PII
LHLPGAGAVFVVPCDEFNCSADFSLWATSSWERDSFNASSNFRENLTAIFCIVRPTQTERVSRAAMAAGSHGPVVYYCAGRGLRDRLGWLRITKTNDKEVMVVIVDNADAVAVTEAMIEAGDIDLPGHGFLFRMPVQMGVINIGSTFGRRRHAANVQQIIAAIDDLQGSSAWRDQRVNQLVGTGKSAGLNLFGKVKERAYLSGQCILSCIVARKHADTIVSAALAGGAPGAHVSFGKLIEAESTANKRGVRFNRERAVVRVVLAESSLRTVVSSIEASWLAHEIGEICVYNQPVTRAITYIPDAASRSGDEVGGSQ